MNIQIGTPLKKNERRLADRTTVLIKTTARERGRTAIPADLTSISTSGCEIRNLVLCSPDNLVWTRIPGLESSLCQVIWTDGARSGLKFVQPLHPAVAARFADSELVSVVSGTPAASGDNILQLPTSRREQIRIGHADAGAALLYRKNKRPNGSTVEGLIKRSVRRQAQHRHEERYADPTASQSRVLLISKLRANLENVSASGLKARVNAPGEIGSKVAVEFGELPPIEGRVVWIQGGYAGIDLPPHSIELSAQI